MDIMKLIAGQLNNPDTLSRLGQPAGVETSQVQQLVQLGLPTLLQALGQNAATAEGAEALTGALTQHQDDNVEDIEGFLNNVNTEDGAKMLGHIFADRQQSVNSNLAQQTGLESSQVSGVMAQLAPLVLGALGQQKKEQDLDSTGVAGLLSGLLAQGGGGGGLADIAMSLLDADKDGDVMDDVGDMLSSFLKK